MATAKKNTYASEGIEWLKARAEEIREDVESTPYNEVVDRIVSLEGTKGPSEKVVQTKEAIQKSLRESLREYAQIIEIIDKLEIKEEAKTIKTRGNASMPIMAGAVLNR